MADMISEIVERSRRQSNTHCKEMWLCQDGLVKKKPIQVLYIASTRRRLAGRISYEILYTDGFAAADEKSWIRFQSRLAGSTVAKKMTLMVMVLMEVKMVWRC